jgi:hypothetical protein
MANWKDVRNFIETGEEIKPIPEGMEMYPVVGVSFIPGYPDNIHNIRKAMEEGHKVSVDLVRNPHNMYDSNAIEVRTLGRMLGHLPREIAAKLAPLMDAGKQYKATVYQVRVSPDNPSNPGMDILLDEVR